MASLLSYSKVPRPPTPPKHLDHSKLLDDAINSLNPSFEHPNAVSSSANAASSGFIQFLPFHFTEAIPKVHARQLLTLLACRIHLLQARRSSHTTQSATRELPND